MSLHTYRITDLSFIYTNSGILIGSDTCGLKWEDEVDLSFLQQHVLDREKQSVALPENVAVLLTGATGFLGRFILWELLHLSHCAVVYCIARDSNGMTSNKKIS